MEGKTFTLGWHLVAFLDVLGQREKFRELRIPKTSEERAAVQQVMRDTVGFVSNLRDMFRRQFEVYESGIKSLPGSVLRPDFVSFSDSFIVSVPLQGEGHYVVPLVRILSTLSATSITMIAALASKHALRGGIDVGLGTETGPGEIYGTALERAYLLESRNAGYPRILIGDELWKYWLTGCNEFGNTTTESGKAIAELFNKQMEFVTEDADGRRIVDYLGKGLATIALPDHASTHVKPAYDFVIQQEAHWRSKANCELAGRYSCLRRYFESRLPLWGLAATES